MYKKAWFMAGFFIHSRPLPAELVICRSDLQSAPVSSQFTYCYQLISSICQVLHYRVCSHCRRLVQVMHQDNRAVICFALYTLDRCGCTSGLPVQRIYGPHYDWHPCSRRRGSAVAAIWRPQQTYFRSCQISYRLARCLQC